MPPLNHLNLPPNPFWDFVADMQDHPIFAAYGLPPRPGQPRAPEPVVAAGSSNTIEKEAEKENVEDPPEVDPAAFRAQAHDNHGNRRRERRGCRRRDSSSGEEGERGGRRCGGRRGWGGRHGPPPSGPFGPGFPFGRGPGAPFWVRDETSPPGPPPPGFGPGPRGRGGFHHRGGPQHPHPFHAHHPHHPQHHGHHHGPGPRGPSPPPPPGPSGFDLSQFLNDLGQRIGMDLTGAAQNLGLDRFLPTHGDGEADFEPSVDIFDLTENYVVHVSLPGAKKSDVGVDWDGERSALHVAGVVHRPDVDEAMLGKLVVDGRKRETGVFEKLIKLGTRREPANVDVANIKARMRDGVLIITVPKFEKGNDKREVPIAKSESSSPVRGEKQRNLLFDADEVMAEAGQPDGEIQMIDRSTFEKSNTNKGKQTEVETEKEHVRESRESSATIEAEPETQEETLPVYRAVPQEQTEHEHYEHDDWENFESDEEGEFVKINVD